MLNISEFEPYLPENIEIVKTDDETIWAEKMITELQGNIVTAIFLVMILAMQVWVLELACWLVYPYHFAFF